MFKKNCVKEVKNLILKINKSLSANKLIGIQEINQYLKEYDIIRSVQRT